MGHLKLKLISIVLIIIEYLLINLYINILIILLFNYIIYLMIKGKVIKMLDNISFKDVINSIVPISRFNKGEANKIFSEVSKTGYKVVVKNNKPTCILITPERYEEMMDIIEDYALLFEAERRVKSSQNGDYISQDTLLKNLGIDEEDFGDIEVEIE